MIKFFKFNIRRNKKNIKAGFTLVETLIAISIFSVSLIALLSMLSKGINDVSYAKKKIIAGYLAQEGIEYVRNMRDTYAFNDAGGAQIGWSNFNLKLATASCAAANGCYFDDANGSALFSTTNMPMTTVTYTACGAVCPTLLYYPATGRYNYSLGANSGFVRRILAVPVAGAGGNETKITSTVYWTTLSGTYNVTLSEDLFNWAE